MSSTLFSVLIFLVYGCVLSLFSTITYVSYRRFGISLISNVVSVVSFLIILVMTLNIPFYLESSILKKSDYQVKKKENSVEFIAPPSDTLKNENIWVYKHSKDTSKVKLKRIETYNLFGKRKTNIITLKKQRQKDE